MSFYSKNNKFFSYLLILISLFIVILVTKTEVMDMQEKLDQVETYNIQLSDTKNKLAELNNLKNELKKSDTNISKYVTEIKEDEIIDYIYSFVEETNDQYGITIIKSISISDSTDTEIWFKETLINLNLVVPNEEKLKTILDFFTSSKSKYNFFISSFSFPYSKTEQDFSVSIPLKVLHK